MATIQCTGRMELPVDDDPARRPAAVHAACGRSIEIDPDGPWDVKTDAAGVVVSRHRGVTCPSCGTSTFVEESELT